MFNNITVVLGVQVSPKGIVKAVYNSRQYREVNIMAPYRNFGKKQWQSTNMSSLLCIGNKKPPAISLLRKQCIFFKQKITGVINK